MAVDGSSTSLRLLLLSLNGTAVSLLAPDGTTFVNETSLVKEDLEGGGGREVRDLGGGRHVEEDTVYFPNPGARAIAISMSVVHQHAGMRYLSINRLLTIYLVKTKIFL